MEPIISKLQEGVKYPRFERDATKIINDLVEHITKERGVYSSSIEPNPSEHSVWFNTNTNELMIYDNGFWKSFIGDNTWKIEDVRIYQNSSKQYEIDTPKDKHFYIVNIPTYDYIQIINISNDIEFYMYISNMPTRLYFPNSNIITNYDTIVRHTTGNNIVGMTVLVHKIGNIVEFSIINDKTDASSKDYVYTGKATKAELPFVGIDGKVYFTRIAPIDNENNITQFDINLPSNVETSVEYNHAFRTNGNVQIVYPPFKFALDYNYNDTISPNIVVFKNTVNAKKLNLLSLHNSDTGHTACLFLDPNIYIFDNFKGYCETYFPYHSQDSISTIVMKGGWKFLMMDIDEDIPLGYDVIIENFNVDDYTFTDGNNDFFFHSIIINNNSDLQSIYRLFDDFANRALLKENYNFIDNSINNPYIIFTSTCKLNSIFIPYHSSFDGILFIIVTHKLTNNFELISAESIEDNENLYNGIVFVTNRNNYSILYDKFKNTGIPVIDTLRVSSTNDNNGLLQETYDFNYNGDNYHVEYNRYDTPLI